MEIITWSKEFKLLIENHLFLFQNLLGNFFPHLVSFLEVKKNEKRKEERNEEREKEKINSLSKSLSRRSSHYHTIYTEVIMTPAQK